jgi:hypothetical protein
MTLTSNPSPETFEEFKNSFSYGSRSDMNFKFLKGLSDVEAGKFFQELLWKLGDPSNDGQLDPVIKHIYQWQVQAYLGKTYWEYEDAPFTSMSKPVSEAKIGLLTTSGHFVEGDDPKPFGAEWMQEQNVLNNNWEDLKPHDDLGGEVIEVIKIKDKGSE